jgi:cytochrome b
LLKLSPENSAAVDLRQTVERKTTSEWKPRQRLQFAELRLQAVVTFASEKCPSPIRTHLNRVERRSARIGNASARRVPNVVEIDTAKPSADTSPPTSVKVWDLFVRVFHWSLVTLFALAFLTGEEIEWLHVWAGYAVAALLAMRILWGFIGSRYARFSSFVTRPRAVATFLKQSVHMQAPRYLGHNPAGGAMVVVLLVIMSALCGTGIVLTMDGYSSSSALEEVHEVLASVMLILIAVHVLGVIVASIEHGENLVKSMITGRKRLQ